MIKNNLSPENYIVLARRTRPQSLSELVGQEVISNAIGSMLTRKKIPHAFLFTGTRGTGKTSSARILAKSLCCIHGPTETPCQTCVHCVQITACAHDDVLEIDGASHTGVDNVRELKEAARFFPNSAAYKIFIIDEVHMLSAGAFNALLKTLEEPPPQVVFILATTEIHKVPITVRSRCMIFSFKKIETEVIAEHLKNILTKENITFENDAITIIAREAKGSIRDSISLLEQAIALCEGSHITTEKTKNGLCIQGEEIAENIFVAICEKAPDKAIEHLQKADKANLDISILVESTASLFRSAMLIKTINNKEKTLRLAQLLPKEFEFISMTAHNLSCSALSEIFRLLSSSVKEISRTNAGLSWAEIIILDCISRAEWLSASEILSLLHNKNSSVSLPEPKVASKQMTPTTPVPIPNVIHHTNSNSSFCVTSFKKLILAAEKRSQTLASRLGFVKVEHFNKELVQFADIPENETYLSFNEKDYALFWESIQEIEFSNAEFKGIFTPKKPTQIASSKPHVPITVKKETPVVEPPINPKNISHNIMTIAQNFQKSQATSLAEIKTQEKNDELKKQEKAILAREHIKPIQKLATEIKIVPLEQS